MVTLRNIGGTLCSMPQSLADAHDLTAMQWHCQDAKAIEISWEPGVTQTTGSISAASKPKQGWPI